MNGIDLFQSVQYSFYIGALLGYSFDEIMEDFMLLELEDFLKKYDRGKYDEEHE